MTVEEIRTLRDEAVRTALYASQTHGDKSVQYRDAQKAVEFYDAEIAKAEAAQSSPANRVPRATLARFRND